MINFDDINNIHIEIQKLLEYQINIDNRRKKIEKLRNKTNK